MPRPDPVETLVIVKGINFIINEMESYGVVLGIAI